ncbi:Fur family transcriptional regulator [Vibrio agarivorans]|uniref:Transcriptional repressor n=1 Tax=Vibrio agarivorans TaxID=153622 RepID=A0ABT7Y5J9_9VIBR|nr:transcriptional repressor [Vibrio agarivorans]MDN2483325.1 transcriptional repressor [Vibrio agarivorans]
MNKISTVIEHVEKRCKARGKTLTPQRQLILKALVHADRALSAYDLVDYSQHHFSQSIQPMSVYRVLDFLESEHFAHKLKASNKYIACSHILCDHAHGIPQILICSKCNKISEQTVDPELLESIQTHAKQQGFIISSPQLELNGICRDCAEKH